jgi:hypothetical protein
MRAHNMGVKGTWNMARMKMYGRYERESERARERKIEQGNEILQFIDFEWLTGIWMLPAQHPKICVIYIFSNNAMRNDCTFNIIESDHFKIKRITREGYFCIYLFFSFHFFSICICIVRKVNGLYKHIIMLI